MNTHIQQQFTDVSTPGHVADALGDARAQLATVKARVKFLEDMLKLNGQPIVEGDRYRVAISFNVETSHVDWKAVAAKFAPSRQLVTAHTKTTHADKLRISALSKGEA